jgi:hypothetical protein
MKQYESYLISCKFFTYLFLDYWLNSHLYLLNMALFIFVFVFLG